MAQKRSKRKSEPTIIEAYYKKGVCPYSDDCFKCPEPDCMVNPNFARRINQLPYDIERGQAAKGKNWRKCDGRCKVSKGTKKTVRNV